CSYIRWRSAGRKWIEGGKTRQNQFADGVRNTRVLLFLRTTALKINRPGGVRHSCARIPEKGCWFFYSCNPSLLPASSPITFTICWPSGRTILVFVFKALS